MLFLLFAAASLLIVPGPTNTLLFTSGATFGVSKSCFLLVGELLGYVTTILLLREFVLPLSGTHPKETLFFLKFISGFYLLVMSYCLWKSKGSSNELVGTITVQRVFITTMLNPKCIVIALGIPTGQNESIISYVVFLCALISTVGFLWICAGNIARRNLKELPVKTFYRMGSVLLLFFATIMLLGSFSLI